MTDGYESDALLRQYLDFHYRSGDPDYLPHHPLPDGVLDYPRRCAALLIEYAETTDHALDLGCAVGGASFELATAFNTVTGIDFSSAFIRAATALAREGVFRLPEPSLGDGQGSSEHAYHPPSEPRKCVPAFRVGDACGLAPDLGPFDAALLANLMCRLPDPAASLDGLRKLMKPGGIIVVTTPCSWDEAYTPREKWLWPTLEGLHRHLDPWCDCLEVDNLPFVLRDHERRAQFTVAQSSVWRKIA